MFSLAGVDIQGGSLVLSYSGSSLASTVNSILAAGCAQGFKAGSAEIFDSTAAATGMTLGWSDNGSNAVRIMATVQGDANLDGRVDVYDLSAVLASYDATGIVWAHGDFNYDGRVDINDLDVVLNNYDRSASTLPAFAAVPEPSVLVLLFAALVALTVRLAWTPR